MRKIILQIFILATVNMQAQNVGIGNTNPAFRADISGRLRIRGGADLNSSAGLWLSGIASEAETNKAFIGMATDTSMGFYGNTGAGWGLTMDINNGNAAVGNGTPLNFSGFTVNNKVGKVNAMFGSNNAGIAIESDYPGIGFNTYYNGSRKAIAFGYGAYAGVNPVSGGLQLQATSAAYTAGSTVTLNNGIILLPNGNTGIGTVNPNAPLQFANTSANRKLVLWEGSNNDHEFYGFGINGTSLRYQTASAAGDHVFYSALDPGFSLEIMRLKGNGNVGIGVVNPLEKLEVAGKIKTTSLQVTTGAATGNVLTSDAAGNASWQPATAPGTNTGIEVSTLASQVVSSGVSTKVTFDDKLTDPALAFSTATSEWTIPSAGFYHIAAALKFFTMLPANTEAVIYLRVNGADTKFKYARLTGQSTIDISADIALAANDKVTVYIFQNSGAAATISNGRVGVWLSGFKVY